MNLQEREQLNLFLQQLVQVQASQKDSEADQLIRDACARQPDAGYLLVQRAMQLEHGLQAMKAKLDQVQAELERARSGTQTSFLTDANAWGKPAPTPVSPTAASPAPAFGAPMQPRAPTAAPAAAAPSAWGSGILGSVATTAAGVVAGSFLFQGIQNMMGHHDGSGAANVAANATPPVTENTVVNNYYDGSGSDDAVDVADAGSDSASDDMA
jgi:hypothetical protein